MLWLIVPPERRCWPRAGNLFSQVTGAIESSIHHDMGNVVGSLYVLERVAIDNLKIG
jgi:hypothetical protein